MSFLIISTRQKVEKRIMKPEIMNFPIITLFLFQFSYLII